MDDSPDIFGEVPDEDRPEDDAPSAAELEAAGQSSMFGAPEPAPAPAAPPVVAAAPAQPYRVLARKYRPQTFSELIGQDAMVQTLGNAIRRERLAHAFLMTGVRGVGKTSTARLIAKALNCIGPEGQGGPTIDPCGQCEPCLAIAEGRHIDVIEMDAASHTGVDDVREIIEAVRYAAVSARYKIYIIDEVHMLSRNAFNALLKTLEEPPAHVKFLFATTEVDKLPVTVLSRCQRFDLRRIPTPMLAEHFGRICTAEGVEAEAEALAMVAAAAEGSVRDGLSILDQAIAHADLGGEGHVTAAQVRTCWVWPTRVHSGDCSGPCSRATAPCCSTWSTSSSRWGSSRSRCCARRWNWSTASP
jgi:DNA polymerase-3 subunit gamma/tau